MKLHLLPPLVVVIMCHSLSYADIYLWLTTTTIDENTIHVNLYARSTTTDLEQIDAVQWALAYNEDDNIPSTTLNYDFAADWGPMITIQSVTVGSYDHLISWMGFKGNDKTISSAAGGTLLATVVFSKTGGSWGTVHIVEEGEGSGYGSGITNNGIKQTLHFPVEDTSLPVQLSSFTAKIEENHILLTWITQSEVNVWGFNIYRSDEDTTRFWRLNQEIINGAGSSASEQIYRYVDKHHPKFGTVYYRLECVDRDGSCELFGPISITWEQPPITRDFYLQQNYPNPFNSNTNIAYHLPNPQNVMIKVYGLLGREICTLINKKKEAGLHTVQWNGKDNLGNEMASGLYIITMQAGNHKSVQKIHLIR
jgi:hypothetical protein